MADLTNTSQTLSYKIGDNVYFNHKITFLDSTGSKRKEDIEITGSGYIYDDLAWRNLKINCTTEQEPYVIKVSSNFTMSEYDDKTTWSDLWYAYKGERPSSYNRDPYNEYTHECLIIPDTIKNLPPLLFPFLKNLYRKIIIGSGVETIGVTFERYNEIQSKFRNSPFGTKGYRGLNKGEVFDCFGGEEIEISANNKVLKTIGRYAFYNWKTEGGIYEYTKYKVKEIDFRGLPEVIDQYAFGTEYSNEYRTVWTGLNLGKLTYVGPYAFAGCRSLPYFNKDNEINGYIGRSAFLYCENINSFTFGNEAYLDTGGKLAGFFKVATHKSNNIETTINTNNEIFLDYNWDNDGRIVKTSANTKVIYVAYNNKWIQLNVYKTGDIPVALDDVYCYLKLVELNDKNASPIKVNTPTGFKALSY